MNGILTTPTAAGVPRWETLFTPYNPGKGTPNLVGTFETRAFVPLPIVLGLQAKYNKKTRVYTLTGKLTEGGQPVSGTSVAIARGATAAGVKKVASATTGATGSFKNTGKLKPRKTTFFQATASAAERDYTATGCQSPLPATVAPAGCVSATLSPWTAKSATVRIKS